MRPYPLDPDPQDQPYRREAPPRRRQGIRDRAASTVAGYVLTYQDLRYRRPGLTHIVTAMLLTVLGMGLFASAAFADTYLHRGVESGVERPYVVQPSGRELSTNVDLRRFSQEERGDVARTIGDSGFVYVRQTFQWSAIEPRQGQFTWDVYDQIVSSLNAEGVSVIAVVAGTPDWAVTSVHSGVDAPPTDPALLGTFVQQLTSHFGSRVPFVQVWDRPNLASHWGGTPATGATFQPYLTAAFYGADSGNPTAQVVTPELAVLSDVPGGLGDLDFVESLYDANAEGVFDIVGISLDGGHYSPDDRSVAATRFNFSRAILFRELMVRNGDGGTPVWATSFGWASNDATGISREEQAEYVLRALRRAWSEWPWMGLMIQWEFATQEGDPGEAYAVAPKGGSTPLFDRLVDPALRHRADLANTGFAPMDADAISYNGNWNDQHLVGRTFRTTNQTGSGATIRFHGTGLIAFVRSGPTSGNFRVQLDGTTVPGGAGDNGDLWSYYFAYQTDDYPRFLLKNLDDDEHTVTITLESPGELTLGGFVVEREPPFVWPVILLTGSGMILTVFGLRSFIYFIAIRAGHVRRGDVVDPILPRLPDWAPGRRA